MTESATADVIEDFPEEETGADVREFYCCPGTWPYWWRNDRGQWVNGSLEMFRRRMDELGIPRSISKEERKQNPDAQVPLQTAYITDVENNRRVDYAGPVAGWPAGVHEMNGLRVLVPRDQQFIEPKAPAEDAPRRADGSALGWPMLSVIFENLLSSEGAAEWRESRHWFSERGMLNGLTERDFDAGEEEGSVDQRAHFFSWLKVAYTAIRERNHAGAGGHALVLVGKPRCGKSLLWRLLAEVFGGNFAMPYKYMTGKTSEHNSDLAGAVLQVVDDENTSTRWDPRQEFGANIKQIVAVPGARVRGMGVEGKTLSPFWRLVVCLNDDPDAMKVLPEIDEGLADKLMIFRCYRRPMPMISRTPREQQEFWAALLAEMPHFLHWITTQWETPRELLRIGRYGVDYYHHPHVSAELDALGQDGHILQIIDRTIWSQPEHGIGWTGTVEDLVAYWERDSSGLLENERRFLAKMSPSVLGQNLKKLAKRPYLRGQIFQHRTKTERRWILLSAEEAKDPRDAQIARWQAKAFPDLHAEGGG